MVLQDVLDRSPSPPTLYDYLVNNHPSQIWAIVSRSNFFVGPFERDRPPRFLHALLFPGCHRLHSVLF